MAPAVSRVTPPVPSVQRTRTPRVLLIPFDGTWANRLGDMHATVVSEFPSLIAKEENVDNGYREGVGASGGPIEKAFCGALGSGVVENVLKAFIKLTDDYNLGDIIVVIGFSRGAFTARVFAALTSLVGLLKTETNPPVSSFRTRLFHQKIREGLVSGKLWDIDTFDELRDGYEFHDNVSIDALCLFDTVASLGVPKVGAGAYIAPILRMLPAFRKDSAHFEHIVRHPPKEVRYVFQAISIHETRATYHEEVAQKHTDASNQIFKQMWFLGNHSNMAWNTSHRGFADAPLAWMIGQLHAHLHLRFDEGRLHERFPTYPRSMNLAGPISVAASTSGTASNSSTPSTNALALRPAPTGPLPHWIHKDVKASGAFKTFCHGWNQRTPGRYGDRTSEEVHITVRLRGFGRNRADSVMVPGYQAVADGRKWTWVRVPLERTKTIRWGAGDRRPAALPSIDEGTMLPLEAALLGLSWCLVRERH
ncbi:hypothetical protein BDZ45DRAFT_752588 [Acephala macrosclerotiorum]|nr:hypothetical protein BDZ45DRAFT_752588 [Acephala macrosclerotiorum]